MGFVKENVQSIEVLSQHPDLFSTLDDERLEWVKKELLAARDVYLAAAEKALVAIGKTAHKDDEFELADAIRDDEGVLTLRLARQAL